jgi:hypothetical protein
MLIRWNLAWRILSSRSSASIILLSGGLLLIPVVISLTRRLLPIQSLRRLVSWGRWK